MPKAKKCLQKVHTLEMTTVPFDTIITGVGNCSTHVYASGEHNTCRVQNSSGNIWYTNTKKAAQKNYVKPESSETDNGFL